MRVKCQYLKNIFRFIESKEKIFISLRNFSSLRIVYNIKKSRSVSSMNMKSEIQYFYIDSLLFSRITSSLDAIFPYKHIKIQKITVYICYYYFQMKHDKLHWQININNNDYQSTKGNLSIALYYLMSVTKNFFFSVLCAKEGCKTFNLSIYIKEDRFATNIWQVCCVLQLCHYNNIYVALEL